MERINDLLTQTCEQESRRYAHHVYTWIIDNHRFKYYTWAYRQWLLHHVATYLPWEEL